MHLKSLGIYSTGLSISTPAFHSLIKTTFLFHSRGWLKGMLDIPLDSNCRFHQTACWHPKVICVYRRIAVVMDSVEFRMTSQLPSSRIVKGPEAVRQNCSLCNILSWRFLYLMRYFISTKLSVCIHWTRDVQTTQLIQDNSEQLPHSHISCNCPK